jgi:tetratricopeptide (TPR) repeat protein
MADPRADVRTTCPAAPRLQQYLRGEVSGEDGALIEQHVEGCSRCQEGLDRLVGSLPGLLGPTPGEGGGEDEEAPRVPGWETLARIDAGGMGVVWRVRDLAFDRVLAVKVMKAALVGNVTAQRRFRAEARITARLAHPFIVPVHEMGQLPDGRPYYTMKLVEGKTLAALLEERRESAARRRDLVPVFGQVCQALAFAHSRDVIHRDLKPANVMVGEHGEVQVMDWGLAKVLPGEGASPATVAAAGAETLAEAPPAELDGRTAAGVLLGTPTHMAPEQACGRVEEVDRRSDVFGLGAILCEVLTGEPPYGGPDVQTVLARARAADLAGALSGLRGCGAEPELTRLAERCLAPHQADRPDDAGAVAAAVADYLAGVEERLQQERLARGRQEVRAAEGRRRRRVWAVAGVIVVLALAAGVVVSAVFALRERATRRGAEESRRGAEESLAFLERVLSQANPDSEPNRNLSVREVVDRASRDLDEGAVKTPEMNARLRITLGQIYFNLGDYPRSRDLFAAAHRVASADLGENHPTALTALDQLGKAYLFLEDFDHAEAALKKAYELQLKVLGRDNENTIHTHAKLADLYAATGEFDQALKIGSEVLEERRRRWGDKYEFTLVSMNNLGTVYRDLGRPEEALPLFEQAEATARRTLGDARPSTLVYQRNRGLACADLGRWQEARGHLSNALAGLRQVLGENHRYTLNTEHGLARVLLGLGKPAEAQERLESILARLGPDSAGDDSFRGLVLVTLGKCCTALGQYQDAEQALQEARTLLSRKLKTKHPYVRAAEEAIADWLEAGSWRGDDEGQPGENPRP